jgi:hypothetical protein
VPVLRHLTFITPNANELLAIAAAVKQRLHPSSLAGSTAHNSSSLLQPSVLEQASCLQQLLAQLVPAAVTVLSQGRPCCSPKSMLISKPLLVGNVSFIFAPGSACTPVMLHCT